MNESGRWPLFVICHSFTVCSRNVGKHKVQFHFMSEHWQCQNTNTSWKSCLKIDELMSKMRTCQCVCHFQICNFVSPWVTTKPQWTVHQEEKSLFCVCTRPFTFSWQFKFDSFCTIDFVWSTCQFTTHCWVQFIANWIWWLFIDISSEVTDHPVTVATHCKLIVQVTGDISLGCEPKI